jgi:hypothetical protein
MGAGLDRTRVDNLQGATTWTGQGVYTYNLTKIAALTAYTVTSEESTTHHDR